MRKRLLKATSESLSALQKLRNERDLSPEQSMDLDGLIAAIKSILEE